MSDQHFAGFERHAAAQNPITYSPSVQLMMQDVLRTLADIDFEHDSAMEQLDRSETDRVTRHEIAARLRQSHQERRAPYLRLLADLRMRVTSGSVQYA